MSKFYTGQYEPVDKAKKGCKRCGSHDVAWRESNTGKWYLIEVFDFAAHGEAPNFKAHYRDFHSGYCEKPQLHAVEQSSISMQLDTEKNEREKLSVRQEERKAAEESAFFLGLHDLCKNNPKHAQEELARRENELAYESANYVSMDYLSEHIQHVERCKRLRTEIAFMQAALGMTEDED